MSKCTKTGAEVSKNAEFCSNDESVKTLENKKSLSFILGVISICTFWTTLPAMIIAIIGRAKAREKDEKILNVVGLVLSILTSLAIVAYAILIILVLVGAIKGIAIGTTQGIINGALGK